MIDNIKANLKREREILSYLIAVDRVEKNADEIEFYNNVQKTLMNELKILNSTIPDLVSAISAEKKAEKEKIEEKVRKRIVTIQGDLSVKKINKEEYLNSLQIENDLLKELKKRISKKEEKKKDEQVYAQIGAFTKISGKIFGRIGLNIGQSEVFKPLSDSLKKASMPYLTSTYISMAFLGTLISFFASLLFVLFLILSEMINPVIGIVMLAAIPLATFMVFYFYPSAEANTGKGAINDELPFAVMHMAAIAGSGIEPSKIFTILATSNEYPAIRKEMRKIINQINFYGYNLVAALKETAKTTSSDRFADVLGGISTTISSGGDLKEYLGKVASDTLLDYKLRRKRFTTISETYADIYTGLLVAAPLMFMLILVLMNVIGGGFGGMSAGTISVIGIGVLIVMNIGFLVFLQVSQPEA